MLEDSNHNKSDYREQVPEPASQEPEVLSDVPEQIEGQTEQEKPPLPAEKIAEQPPVQPSQPSPLKDEDKASVLQAAEKLRDIKFEGRKIEHLLGLAQSKGVDFAIEVAKKTNDACLLDLFHDKLVEKKLRP